MFYSTTKGICFGISFKFLSSWLSRFQLGKSTSGSASELHKLPTFSVRAFGILPMVPLEILPMVPLVANGTIGNTRTLNVSRLPIVPLVPILPLVETLVPMVPLVSPMVSTVV